MARIIYPTDFTAQQALFNQVKAKHTADGAASPLTAYLSAQGIDLNAAGATDAQALSHHNSGGLLSRQSESFLKLRDAGFNTVFTHFKGEVQFLKSFYKGNPRALGDWGITVDGQSRVVYPASFDDKVALFNTFAQKHLTYGFGDSPLQQYLTLHGIDMAADQNTLAQAVQNNEAYLAASRTSEEETASRNNLHTPVIAILHGIGDFLKKLYDNNAKSLGAWGFTVDNSPRAPKLRTTSLKIAAQITISAVSIGGMFTNTGSGDLHVYRGKTTTGTPFIIHAGGEMGMVKGFSTITVVNPSTTIGGKFTVLSSNI